MTSLDAAARIVSRARRRLAAAQATERAADGVLAGAALAVAGLVAERFVPGLSLGLVWLSLPAAGALAGAVELLIHPPVAARAALAVDRAAGTHEAFVSALTAEDAAPPFRELAADHGLRLLGNRSLATLLPLGVPRRAAPALAAAALVAALTAVGAAPDAVGAVPPDGGAAAVAGLGGQVDGGAPGATAGTTPVPPAAGVAVPVAGTSSPQGATAPPPVTASGLPGLTDGEIESLAQELAERGLAVAERALDALRSGDRAAAEAMLREALVAPARAGPGGALGGEHPGSAAGPSPVAPGAWSAGAWPLRYDRAVRAWLRRQAATDEGGDARTEER